MKSTVKEAACVASVKLLGDYWTLRIIDSLADGELRYCELQRAAGNANPVTFTAKLKKLERTKLINRSEETIDKISVTYSLTEAGRSVLPVIRAIDKFSKKLQSA